MIHILDCTSHKKYFPTEPIATCVRNYKVKNATCTKCKMERMRLNNEKNSLQKKKLKK